MKQELEFRGFVCNGILTSVSIKKKIIKYINKKKKSGNPVLQSMLCSFFGRK